MNDLEKLIEQESNADILRDLKLALYLYKDLLTDDNKKLLDEYTKILLNIFKKKGFDMKEKFFSNNILELFYYFLIKNEKTEKTSYDYAKRVEKICKEYGISVDSLFNETSGYSISDLIGMYSSNGIKSEENKKKHNAPLSALKQFRDFMNNCKNNLSDFENASFYLCDTEGYQSWEIMSRHPYKIEIKGNRCEITFKENRKIADKVSKIINDANYYELINVFRKYKNILSQNIMSSMQSFPHGGVHSYYYQFEDKSNHSGCATLFESNDRKIETQAYKEYHTALQKIINQ